MDQNWSISFVRTIVAPLIVGWFWQFVIFAWSDGVSLTTRAVTAAIIAAGFYILARIAQIANPQLGFLLIIAAQPHYDDNGELVTENELLISIVRTVVPLAVATVVSCLVTYHVGGSTPALILVAVASGYYGILRLIEQRSVPDSTARNVTGWMLGSPAVPHY